MAGCGLGNTTQNFLALSFVYGMNQTIDTLVSTAWGDNKPALCSVYLYRGRFILCLFYIPVAVILFHSENMLIALGQDPQAAKYAQEYMIAFLPGLVLLGLIDLHRRFLNSVGHTRPPFICLLVGTILHYFLSKYLVIEKQMGIKGTGIAGLVMNIVVFLLQHLWAQFFIP